MTSLIKIFEFDVVKIRRDFPIVGDTLCSFLAANELPFTIVGTHREVKEILEEALSSLLPLNYDDEVAEHYEEEKVGFLQSLKSYVSVRSATIPEDIEDALCDESEGSSEESSDEEESDF